MSRFDTVAQLIAGLLTAALTGGCFKGLFEKRRYREEVNRLRAEVEALKTGNRADELENIRKASAILMEQIVEPLRGELEDVRKDMAQLRRAVDRMGDCEHYSRCPVRAELQKQAGSGGDAGGED